MKKRNFVIAAVFAAAIAAVIVVPKLGSRAGGAAGGAPGMAAPAGGMPRGAPGGAPSGFPGGAAGMGGLAEASVRTATVRRGAMQDYLETNGDIVSDSAVKLYPYVSGKLVSLKVSLGERVAKGQLVAEIDPSTPGSAYSLSPVYASIAGTVTSLPVSPGSTVSTATAVAEVGVMDSLEVEAKIAERYVGVLRVGLKASVSLEAYPGETFAATVTSVSPIVDPTSRTKTIRLSFDRRDGRINAGMFAKIRLDTVAYTGRLIIEGSAVLADSTGAYVFVVNGDATVSKRRVTTGADVDGVVELASGVKEGETVVIEGASVLADGSKIKDISAPESKGPQDTAQGASQGAGK